MYPPNYYPSPYTVNSYVPCMFCHTTVPANAMTAHLAICQNAHATTVPVVSSNPYGSTQSIQYRRVVRVERKTVDDRNIQPIPVDRNPQPSQLQWNNPTWTLEDTPAVTTIQTREAYPISSTSTNYMARPLPQPPRPAAQVYSQSTFQSSLQQTSQPKVSQVSNVMESVRSVPQPRPAQQVPQPRPAQQVPQPRPVQLVQPKPVQQIPPPKPIQQVQPKPRPAQQIPQPKPIQYSNQPRPVQQVQPGPVQQIPQPRPIQQIPQPRPAQQIPQPRPTQQAQPKPIPQSKPIQQPPQSRPIQPPKPTMRDPSTIKGEVEVIQPGSLSDRIKMFESQSSAPVMPQQPSITQSYPSESQPIEIEEIQPISVSQRKAALEKQLPSLPPRSTPQPSPAHITEFSPAQQTTPVRSSTMEHTPTLQPPAPTTTVEHFEKQNLRNEHPKKLAIPTFVSGQLSLDDILQKRMLQESSTQAHPPTQPTPSPSAITRFEEQSYSIQPKPLKAPLTVAGQKSLQDVLQQKLQQGNRMEAIETHTSQRFVSTGGEQVYEQHMESTYESSNVVQPLSTPIISIDETPESVPSQLLYTANNGYIVLLNKDDVKTLFMANSALPSNGYCNGVLCVYTEQLCFYFFDDSANEYQFIKNLLRSSCVNTRLDRSLAGTNTMYYGILIMDKSQEDIMSIWFTSSEERDNVFNTMAYICWFNKQHYCKRIGWPLP